MKEDHIIDAKGKKLGRVASEAARFLMGKDEPDFQRYLLAGRTVKVINANELDISDKKRNQKEYITFSGYPGGQKIKNMQEVLDSKGYGEVIKKAVYGMLPSNKHRSPLMKRLVIVE